MNLTRTQILNGNYVYTSELVKLRTTKHFTERLEQRGIGVDCIPTLVRITKDNIYCGEAEGKELINVVVRLKYSKSRYIFLCFNPIDGALKTLWFKDKKIDYDNRRGYNDNGAGEQTISDTGNG